jgi:hypothetical protein
LEDAPYDAIDILLKCPETRRLREHLSRKWQIINEELSLSLSLFSIIKIGLQQFS